MLDIKVLSELEALEALELMATDHEAYVAWTRTIQKVIRFGRKWIDCIDTSDATFATEAKKLCERTKFYKRNQRGKRLPANTMLN